MIYSWREMKQDSNDIPKFKIAKLISTKKFNKNAKLMLINFKRIPIKFNQS